MFVTPGSFVDFNTRHGPQHLSRMNVPPPCNLWLASRAMAVETLASSRSKCDEEPHRASSGTQEACIQDRGIPARGVQRQSSPLVYNLPRVPGTSKFRQRKPTIVIRPSLVIAQLGQFSSILGHLTCHRRVCKKCTAILEVFEEVHRHSEQIWNLTSMHLELYENCMYPSPQFRGGVSESRFGQHLSYEPH